jgi:hypothetical protein
MLEQRSRESNIDGDVPGGVSGKGGGMTVVLDFYCWRR